VTARQWILVVWLGISGLFVVFRGVTRSHRDYTMRDAVVGAIEIAVLIWLVTTL
jgi:hypothetical protein